MRVFGRPIQSIALLFFLALAGGSLTAPCAFADITFNFHYSGTDTLADGTLTAQLQGDGSFLVTGISGTWNSTAISGLLPVNPPDNDNLVFLSEPFLTDYGIGFEVSGLSVYTYFYSGYQQFDSVSGPIPLNEFSLTAQSLGTRHFAFSYSGTDPTSGNPIASSGELTALDYGDGVLMLTGISGERNGQPISGLVPTGLYPNDNILRYPGPPHLTEAGLGYFVGSDPYFVAVCGCLNYYELNLASYTSADLDTFTVSEIPEPALWPACALGLLVPGVRRFLRRRNRA